MIESKSSFFDNLTSQSKLWKKESSNLSAKINQILHEGYLLKFSKKRNQYVSRYFVLTPDALYCTKQKKSNDSYGVMTLKWTRFYYNLIVYDECPATLIKFVLNKKSSSFIVTDNKSFSDWYLYLSRICIQTDFHEKFTVSSLLGNGAFASVYLGTNNISKTKHAIKFYAKEDLTKDPIFKKSVLDEIDILRDLSHNNIMKLEEVHETFNTVYLITEYIHGVDLFNEAKTEREFTHREISGILRALLSATVYLGNKNIIHRDLKPSNIMIVNGNSDISQRVKIIDFGLAIHSTDSLSHAICGTPGYIAPETFKLTSYLQTNFTNKIDVFAIGITIYELVHGYLPFQSNRSNEVLYLNQKCKISYSRNKIDKYPNLSNLLQSLLVADPERRISAQAALTHRFFGTNRIFRVRHELSSSQLPKLIHGASRTFDSVENRNQSELRNPAHYGLSRIDKNTEQIKRFVINKKIVCENTTKV